MFYFGCVNLNLVLACIPDNIVQNKNQAEEVRKHLKKPTTEFIGYFFFKETLCKIQSLDSFKAYSLVDE